MTTTIANIVLAALLAACGQATPTTNPDSSVGSGPLLDYEGAARSEAFMQELLDYQAKRNAARRAAAPESPHDFDPHGPEVIDQHFCCQSIDHKSKAGEGCVLIGKEQVETCPAAMFCPGFWSKIDDKVTCE